MGFLRYAGALILNVVYGFDIRNNEDPHLVAPEKAIAAANAVVTEGFFLGMFLYFRQTFVAIYTALTAMLSVDAFPMRTYLLSPYEVNFSDLLACSEAHTIVVPRRSLQTTSGGLAQGRTGVDTRSVEDCTTRPGEFIVSFCVHGELRWPSVTAMRRRLLRRRCWPSWIARRIKIYTTI